MYQISGVGDEPKFWYGKIEECQDCNHVLVFGSNAQGRHGTGMALIARKYWGAKYGQAYALHGRSYAIVTKDLTKKTHPSVRAETIRSQIAVLYRVALLNRRKLFIVPYTDIPGLSGYSPLEMAGMFFHINPPSNVAFHKKFYYLVNY